ncbi:MAG: LPS export ABC transporter periplasmic protein LptC, partial [Alkalinema sp. FL-bin-369]|nr:LPS export ABC transporter periplasmic protein LptC [Leptolyngbyaceae cyanobacterium LF-bin-369]
MKPITKVIRVAAIGFGVVGLVGGMVWLFRPHPSLKAGKPGGDAALIDPSLKLTDVDLEQADEKGNLLWKIKAKQAVYNRDKREGTIVALKGELYQDGKVAFKISADRGAIKGDGKVISLSDNIVAVNVNDGVELKGKDMEWQTQTNLLKLKNKFIATHKMLTVTGNEGQYFSKKQQAELVGAIVAQVKEPKLKMTTEKLNWDLEKQQLDTVAAIAIERKVEGDLLDRATAEKGSYNLKSKIATLNKAVQVTLAKPEVKLTGDELAWDLGKQFIVANKPLTAYSAAEQMTDNADKGEYWVKDKVAILTGNVRGNSQKNSSTIATDKLNWFLDKQEFEATGSVVYRQLNPN